MLITELRRNKIDYIAMDKGIKKDEIDEKVVKGMFNFLNYYLVSSRIRVQDK